MSLGATFLDTHALGDLVHQLARRIVLAWPKRHAAKRLARAAGVSNRTAEAWLAGLHDPSTDAALALIARDPSALAALRADLELIAKAAHATRRAEEILTHAAVGGHSIRGGLAVGTDPILAGPADGDVWDAHGGGRIGADRRRLEIEGAPVVQAARKRRVIDGV